mgnify:CR=1 FL=1
MTKQKFFFIAAFYFSLNLVISDDGIVKYGRVLESKTYSVNEATLVISKSNKIYVCSILDSITRCILSDKKDKMN